MGVDLPGMGIPNSSGSLQQDSQIIRARPSPRPGAPPRMSASAPTSPTDRTTSGCNRNSRRRTSRGQEAMSPRAIQGANT